VKQNSKPPAWQFGTEGGDMDIVFMMVVIFMWIIVLNKPLKA